MYVNKNTVFVIGAHCDNCGDETYCLRLQSLVFLLVVVVVVSSRGLAYTNALYSLSSLAS